MKHQLSSDKTLKGTVKFTLNAQLNVELMIPIQFLKMQQLIYKCTV